MAVANKRITNSQVIAEEAGAVNCGRLRFLIVILSMAFTIYTTLTGKQLAAALNKGTFTYQGKEYAIVPGQDFPLLPIDQPRRVDLQLEK